MVHTVDGTHSRLFTVDGTTVDGTQSTVPQLMVHSQWYGVDATQSMVHTVDGTQSMVHSRKYTVDATAVDDT